MTNKIPRGQTQERRAYMAAYVASHPKRDRRAYKAAYDVEHAAENAAYRAANVERESFRKRIYYEANRDRILACVKARSAANRESVLRYQAEYYSKNADMVRARVGVYRKAHPEARNVLESRRRARKAGNGGSHTLAERREKFAQCGGVCFYCRKPGKLTEDHLIPISRGGTDNIDNIVPACQSCNSRKNKKTAEEHFSRTNHAAIGGVGPKPNDEYRGR